MFTPQQRHDILKYGSLTLLALVLLASLTHGVFFVLLFNYYLPIAIAAFAVYFGYTRVRHINLTDDVIKDWINTRVLPMLKK